MLSTALHPAIKVPTSVLGLSIYGSAGYWRFATLAILMCGVAPVAFMFALARAKVIESVDAQENHVRAGWHEVGADEPLHQLGVCGTWHLEAGVGVRDQGAPSIALVLYKNHIRRCITPAPSAPRIVTVLRGNSSTMRLARRAFARSGGASSATEPNAVGTDAGCGSGSMSWLVGCSETGGMDAAKNWDSATAKAPKPPCTTDTSIEGPSGVEENPWVENVGSKPRSSRMSETSSIRFCLVRNVRKVAANVSSAELTRAGAGIVGSARS